MDCLLGFRLLGMSDKKTKEQTEGLLDTPRPFTKKQLEEREYKQKWRELKIAKTRSFVLRKQITEAYEILENIRFDYLGDTMFRDYIVKAKRELEGAMSDFLLSDGYWERRIKEHRKMTPEEYAKRSTSTESPSQDSIE